MPPKPKTFKEKIRKEWRKTVLYRRLEDTQRSFNKAKKDFKKKLKWKRDAFLLAGFSFILLGIGSIILGQWAEARYEKARREEAERFWAAEYEAEKARNANKPPIPEIKSIGIGFYQGQDGKPAKIGIDAYSFRYVQIKPHIASTVQCVCPQIEFVHPVLDKPVPIRVVVVWESVGQRGEADIKLQTNREWTYYYPPCVTQPNGWSRGIHTVKLAVSYIKSPFFSHTINWEGRFEVY